MSCKFIKLLSSILLIAYCIQVVFYLLMENCNKEQYQIDGIDISLQIGRADNLQYMPLIGLAILMRDILVGQSFSRKNLRITYGNWIYEEEIEDWYVIPWNNLKTIKNDNYIEVKNPLTDKTFILIPCRGVNLSI